MEKWSQQNFSVDGKLDTTSFECECQWWSLDTWSRYRDVSRDPFFRVLVSNVSGLVSVSNSRLVSRLCTSYFFLSLARSGSLKTDFTKQLFKIHPFKTISGKAFFVVMLRWSKQFALYPGITLNRGPAGRAGCRTVLPNEKHEFSAG